MKYVYSNPVSTPLKYFKVLKVGLIIGLILRVGQGINLLTDFSWYNAIYVAVGIGLNIAALIGMFNMMWYGVLSIYGLYLLTVIDNLIALGIIAYYNLSSSLASESIGQILGSGIVLLINWVYFSKRRLLFDPMPANYHGSTPEIVEAGITTEPQYTYDTAGEVSVTEYTQRNVVSQGEDQANQERTPQIRFCRKCGFMLLEDSKFCSQCGTAVMEDTENVLP